MTRKAILIAAPRSKYGDLAGTLIDTRRIADFLRSDHGGAWEPSEIEPTLVNPSMRQLAGAIANAAYCDFTLLSFSGHGYHQVGSPLDGTKVCLNDYEEPFVHDIVPRSSRQLLIVDACRGIVRIAEALEKRGGMLGYAAPPTNRARCRSTFASSVMDADEGRVVMYSCSIDQSAGDSTDQGGVFTRFLVEGAQASCLASRQAGILYADTAFGNAQNATLANNAPQFPEWEPGQRERHFPFGVVAF